MKTLIRNATVVLPQGSQQTSVLLSESRIATIDPAAQSRADEVVDATGLHLLPGVIDSHVHFREPGLTHKEDLEHATRACAKGGVTTFFEMPNTRPSTITCQLLEEKLTLAARKSLVNYGFYIAATRENLHELQQATRTPGIKIFMGSSTGDLLVDQQEDLERIFAKSTLPIAIHSEDEDTVRRNAQRYAGVEDVAVHSRIRDHQAAIIATRRTIDLAERHERRVHILHVSTGDEADLIAQHPRFVTGEVCPHHLLFSVEDYERLGSRVQMNPAIKSRQDNERLWAALRDGRLHTVATDHAPHTLDEKQQPYPKSPSGLPAVENSLALMLDQVQHGRCMIEQVVTWMCEAPARVWQIPNKGRIEAGYDADLVLVDLQKTQEVRDDAQETKCRWSPWHGVALRGWPICTWVMGHVVFRDGQFDLSRRGREVIFAR